MIRNYVALTAVAALGLAACGPKPFTNGAAPAPYANGNGWPGAQNAPGQQANNNPFGPGAQQPSPTGPGEQSPYPQQQSPYPQGPGQQSPYPQQNAPYQPQQQQPGYPGQMQQPQQMPQGQPLQVNGGPPNMHPMQSQAGYVFVTRLSGSPQASKLAQGLAMGVASYFDGAPQITSNRSDPQDQKTEVYFKATLHGAPVMGVIAVNSDGQNSGVGYLLFDSPDRVQQSLPIMAAATRQGGGQPGGNN